MKSKPTLQFYLGFVFLGLGSWKLYRGYIVGEELSNLELMGSIFLVLVGVYRIFQFWRLNQKEKLD